MIAHDFTPQVDRANDLHNDTQTIAKSQARRIHELMFNEPMTRLQAARSAGLVQQANVCRMVNDWILAGKAAVHHLGKCPVTGTDDVEFVTTDPAKFPKPAPDLFTPPETLEGSKA
jgi:hypothetical protein